MRLSTLFGRTLREAPADAEHTAHQLVLRAGLARQLHAGSYALLPLGMRVARRIEAIMHAEMARINAQEFRTPIVQTADLWQRSGRYTEYGPAMLHCNDRTERSLIVAPTHEEAVAELARREITSYRQMPALVYQIHTKYRDETRAKGGLMRMREFTMLDAYTLTADAAGLDTAYEQMADAFERIFARCGVRFLAVEASAGEMGGREPREYMALSPNGEDTLAVCDGCGYAANIEVAMSGVRGQRSGVRGQQPRESLSPQSSVLSPEDVATPHAATIAELATFLGISASETAKAVFFDTPERGLVFAVIRGDRDVNEAKLRAAAGVSALAPASAAQIVAAGAVAGYASPVGLNVDEQRMTNDEGQPPQTANTDVVRSSSGVFVVADQSVVDAGGLIAGANKEGYHLRNVVYGRDWRASVVADIALVRAGAPCPRCDAPLRFEQGIEIGHIFKLGTRFTEALGATYLDQGGAVQPIVMGSYGIGVERLMQVIIEQHHDAAGIVWPRSVAPYDVHLVGLGKGAPIRAACAALYAELAAAGLHVLYDDREESAGVKFNDADLLGVPLRVVFSERLEAAGQVELKQRGGEVMKIDRADVVATVRVLCADS